ncbi:hypothetical protein G6F65_017435 [Rhizopus arrhizus]|nr:hypothetical protein G6F65_017435 [Rhizopus arrhizus]
MASRLSPSPAETRHVAARPSLAWPQAPSSPGRCRAAGSAPPPLAETPRTRRSQWHGALAESGGTTATHAALGAAVGRVVDAIVDRDHAQRERVDALQAGHVVAVLLGIGTTSVVGVDAAHTAEVMLGHMGVELVQPQVVLPAHHLQSRTGHAGGDGATAPAHRAVAAAWVDDAVRQIQQQFDRAAVAGCAVPGLDRNAGHGCNAH